MKIIDDRPVTFEEPLPAWARDGQMAVVPAPAGTAYTIYGRAYTNEPGLPVYRSRIFRAMGRDPFHFVMSTAPEVDLEPALGELACEDPTLVHRRVKGTTDLVPQILYSSVMAKSGADGGVKVSLVAFNVRTKVRTVLLDPTQQTFWERPLDMIKEAEVLVRPREPSDLLFFEFSDGRYSRIGIAGIDLSSRWTSDHLLVDRPTLWMNPRGPRIRSSPLWDSHHVSTGPIVTIGHDRHLMFYNGCRNKSWSIGVAVFNGAGRILHRASRPLIEPPDEIGWEGQKIAFASGAHMQQRSGLVELYYHVADKRIRCAVIDEVDKI